MECGHAAGIQLVIGLATHRRPESLLDAGATHTCRNLDEVRGVLLEPQRPMART
jgi:phosphoglycolate phosphatase-like HAD superfamily hydrolase